MKAILYCEICRGTDHEVRGEITADTFMELGPLLSALLTAWHATPPHCPHRLRVEFEPDPPPDYELVIRCINPRCDHPHKEMRTKVPIEMVGALTVCFHASHEAHPLEITYKDRTWRSPVA